MKPVIEPALPITMMVPPFWSMPVRAPDLALDDEVAAAQRGAGQRAGVRSRSRRRPDIMFSATDQPTRPLICTSGPSISPQPK